jgi:hypothetical protein
MGIFSDLICWNHYINKVSSSSFVELFVFFTSQNVPPHHLSSLRIEAFHRITLLDDGGSAKCFAISFYDRVGLFSTP